MGLREVTHQTPPPPPRAPLSIVGLPPPWSQQYESPPLKVTTQVNIATKTISFFPPAFATPRHRLDTKIPTRGDIPTTKPRIGFAKSIKPVMWVDIAPRYPRESWKQ